jgi:hypothetical protein
VQIVRGVVDVAVAVVAVAVVAVAVVAVDAAAAAVVVVVVMEVQDDDSPPSFLPLPDVAPPLLPRRPHDVVGDVVERWSVRAIGSYGWVMERMMDGSRGASRPCRCYCC